MSQITSIIESNNGSRSPLTTTSAVINALGGTGEVAWLAGVGAPAVSNWRRWASFPARTYLLMTQALADKGLSAPARLWDMEPRLRAKKSAKAEGASQRDDLWSAGGRL